jgi:pilus assembly protein CpaB
MRNKFVPLAVALVFGSVAAVGFSKMMKAGPQVQSVEIYVAARSINPSEEITQDAVKLERWPVDKVAEDAIQDWKGIAGKFAAQRIFAGEMVLGRKLLNEKDSNTVGIPKGFNVVTLKADEASSVGSLVAPGDRVNVIGFFTKSDIIPATTTRTVLSGIKVFAVDGRTAREEPKEGSSTQAARTVSLLIHTGDAEAWTLAKELAKISLSLGRPDEGDAANGEVEGPNPAGQEFLAWLKAYENEQAALLAASQRPATSSQSDSSVVRTVKAEPAKPAVEHKMVKIGPDGKMVVYTWEDGNPVPTVTGNEINTTETPGDDADKKSPGDLSYLNGSRSPLFSQPSGNGGGDIGGANEEVGSGAAGEVKID